MIAEEDLPALERGCVLLGAGGGGATVTVARLLRIRLRGGPVPLVPVEEVPEDAMVVPVGLAGATGMLEEKPPTGREMDAAVAAVARWSGSRVDAIMSVEAGGGNGLAVFTCGRAVVDADLMGRAFPRLGQSSTSRSGARAGPYALVDSAGRTAVFDGYDPEAGERLMHGALQAAGGWAAPFLIYPSLPHNADLNMFIDETRLAWKERRGAWRKHSRKLLLGYEYRLAIKLGTVTPPSKAMADAFQRICVDLRSMRSVGLYNWHRVPPPDRLWFWATDAAQAVPDLGVLPER